VVGAPPPEGAFCEEENLNPVNRNSKADPLRYHRKYEQLFAPFGGDRIGRGIEAISRALGTPQFVIIGVLVVTLWLVANGLAFVTFDRKPFILLNLIFSAQAFFAASFILIAQIRQSARDHAVDQAAALHREELAQQQTQRQEQMQRLLETNTVLIQEVKALTAEIHAAVARKA
jgi:uncharacterized membrane protein